jgi:hypothetical protein
MDADGGMDSGDARYVPEVKALRSTGVDLRRFGSAQISEISG